MIGIVSRLDKEEAISCARKLVEKLGGNALVEYNLWRILGGLGKPFTIGEDVDTLVVIGGDGTLLRALHYYPQSVRVIGVRVGRRGYYMAFSCDEIVAALNDLTRLHWCQVLRLAPHRLDYDLVLAPALNEIAVLASKGKVVDLELVVGDNIRTRINGDGVLVATPTGSYAYNLSARGPLLLSNNNVVITPLNPLKGSEESSIVVKSCSRIVLKHIGGYRVAWILIDGQLVFPLPIGSAMVITCGNKVYIAYPSSCPIT